MKSKIRFSIRKKLLLLSVAVLSLPYMGYQYLNEMEQYLREGLEDSLAGSANTIAGRLNNREDLFPYMAYGDQPQLPLFIHPLKQVVQLDGYAEEWSEWSEWADDYEVNNGAQSAKIIVGERQAYYYILFDIRDQQIVYQRPDKPFDNSSDQIELLFRDSEGELQHYWLAPAGSGPVGVYGQGLIWDEDIWEERPVLRSVTHIAAAWQESDDGYVVELKIPKHLVSQAMGFIITDVDDRQTRKPQGRLATFNYSPDISPTDYPLNPLVRPSDQINGLIQQQELSKDRRIWVLDVAGHVLATQGQLRSHYKYEGLDKFFALFLPSATSRFKDDLAGASRLRGEDVSAALKGENGIRWRSSPDGKAAIVSAAQPVRTADQIIGVVVAEETTGNIQTVQRQAMVTLLIRSLLIFFLVLALVLFFASQLSSRIRRMRREADQAIDEYGRVRQIQVGEHWQDELGDLSVHYSDMLARLKQYNDYLESLASKLSHELRTPMSVVQSSLESLESVPLEPEVKVYVGRAKEGVQRLQTLVTRLSEAARLEEAIQTAERKAMDPAKLMESCIEGYRLAYSEQDFVFENRIGERLTDTKRFRCAPDLIVQMLDKLVSNAADFATDHTPIILSLDLQANDITIDVSNQGPRLPENIEEHLFGSLVSVRETTDQKEPHLGLGLYIVRLIVDFHHGELAAENLKFSDVNGRSGDGVVIRIKLPLYD